ncbi:RNA polymerase sigma-54 factor [Bacteroidia bacterium]|nr:RNA polymerase sigma-54 factor [Bacteroidia bacterium]
MTGRLSQQQLQRQTQKLSSQQIQRIKMLEITTPQLEEKIKQEVEENPALDSEEPEGSLEDQPKEISVDEYVDQQEARSYRYASSGGDKSSMPPADYNIFGGESMSEFLMRQLGYKSLTSRELTLAEYLVGSIEDDGYLRRDLSSLADDIAFSLGIETSAGELEQVLHIIHELEPVGVGSRNLRECLLLQLRMIPDKSESQKLATRIIECCFEEFSKRHFEKVISRLGVTEEQFRDACDDIRRLWPKPGNLHNEQRNGGISYITPDFILDTSNDRLDLSLSSANLPELRINQRYMEMLNHSNVGEGLTKEQSEQARQFVKEKIDAARWFIHSIQKRHDTLLRTMQAILSYQKEYFRSGDTTRLRPMILKDIAQATSLDISTISRVVNGKYIQTSFGTIPLKQLFSEAIATASGSEVSSSEIKHILMQSIEEEDKRNPLNDQQLLDILKARGYNITRRTVAKYRESMKIDVARLRRTL